MRHNLIQVFYLSLFIVFYHPQLLLLANPIVEMIIIIICSFIAKYSCYYLILQILTYDGQCYYCLPIFRKLLVIPIADILHPALPGTSVKWWPSVLITSQEHSTDRIIRYYPPNIFFSHGLRKQSTRVHFLLNLNSTLHVPIDLNLIPPTLLRHEDSSTIRGCINVN